MRNYEESKDISSILGTNKIANKPNENSIAPIRPDSSNNNNNYTQEYNTQVYHLFRQEKKRYLIIVIHNTSSKLQYHPQIIVLLQITQHFQCNKNHKT